MSTFAELKVNVSNELGLDQTASGTEDVLLGRRLNQAVREVLRKTKCRVAVGNTTLTAGENDYELPADVLAVNKIVNSDDDPLDRESVEEIYELRRASTAIGSVGYPYRYAVDGANLLMLYPTPNVTDTLTLYYVPKPTEMSAAGNDPSAIAYGGIPTEYHDLIEFWACYRMASYDDDQSSGIGATYKQQFDMGVREARAEIRRRGGRKLGPVRLGRRSRVLRDPSQGFFYR